MRTQKQRNYSWKSTFPTIGYLGGSMVIEQLWQSGLIDAARSANINLVIFAGGGLENPYGFDVHRSRIFNLASTETVDGLIISSDFLGHYAGEEKIQRFCEQFFPIPIVKNEPLIEGYPTVLFNFYQGMTDLVTHLVEVHQYTRIGFITGPQQSQSIKDRFRAYRDVLENHGIPFDEDLVVEGSIYAPSGDEAVRVFLEDRQLKPFLDIQAIVAFNDFIAVDALAALQARGIRVPDQIAIVGFDDDEFAFTTKPRLTTVRLPFYEMGRWGVETLAAIFSGNPPPNVTTISTPLVIRESCGCQPRDPASTIWNSEPGEDLSVLLSVSDTCSGEQIINNILQIAGYQNIPHLREDVRDLLDTFTRAIQAADRMEALSQFVEQLESILSRMGKIHYNIEVISGVLAALQREMLAIYPDEVLRAWLHNLFQQAYSIASDVIQRFLISAKNQVTYLDNLLHEFNQELATTLDVQDLADVLAQHLPRMGIPSCFVSLYKDPQQVEGESNLILAYNQAGRIEIEKQGYFFPSRQIIPKALRNTQKAACYVIQPLIYRDEQMGFVVFEIGPSYGGLYEALREQISSTLKKIQLHQKLIEARRTAEEANRLKSRFLSMVTHELRTPLSMIVSLSQLLLENSQNEHLSLPEPYRQEIEVIHTTGQHLDRLVLDVLDLGRSQLGQLKLNLEYFNLGEVLKPIDQIAALMTQEKHLTWRSHIPQSLPTLHADRTRLRQILLNLISNACKFTTHGQVSMLVTTGEKEVTISISDTGIGVPLEDQQTIFDEFAQSNRTAARGYGGMGLGLAITRRLVELHGGKINLVSSGLEGSGATVYFTLPIHLATEPVQAELSPRSTSPNTVLVITQLKSSGEMVTNYLLQQGYEVKGIDITQDDRWFDTILSNPCGAIIMDCEPESEWGWDLLRNLRRHPQTNDIPVHFFNLFLERNIGCFLDLNTIVKPLQKNTLALALQQHGLMMHKEQGKTPQKILIVDDEPGILRLHSQLIHEYFPEAILLQAQNGVEALTLLQSHLPDLILLDLMMPEMDGFGVLRALQANEIHRTIPVIIMTGQVLTEEMISQFSRNVAAILGKELYSIEETLIQINTTLSRNKRLGTEPQRIARRAMAHIQKNYADQLSRGDIAAAIGVNERYLTHCFKEEMGITPMEYLKRYRVKIARQMLSTENKSITQVALDVGFSSSSHFSRVFREEMGVSPREFTNQAG